MTPRDVALRIIRQRDTTVSDPEFIAAYLRAELDRDPRAFETDLQRQFRRISEAVGEISEAVGGMCVAGGALSVAVGYAIRSCIRFERDEAAQTSPEHETYQPRHAKEPTC